MNKSLIIFLLVLSISSNLFCQDLRNVKTITKTSIYQSRNQHDTLITRLNKLGKLLWEKNLSGNYHYYNYYEGSNLKYSLIVYGKTNGYCLYWERDSLKENIYLCKKCMDSLTNYLETRNLTLDSLEGYNNLSFLPWNSKTRYITNIYNMNNQIIKSIDYDYISGDTVGINFNKYDSNNNLEYSKSHAYFKHWSYDSQNNLIERVLNNISDTITDFYYYDSKNNLIRQISMDSVRVINKRIIKWSKGKKRKELLYDSKGKIKEETIYFYNCKGKLRKKIYLNNTSKNEPDAIYEGSSKIISKYTYENY